MDTLRPAAGLGATSNKFPSFNNSAVNQPTIPIVPSRKRSLRLVAFCSVAFATVSVLPCVVTIPIVCRHVQNIQSDMENEVAFSKLGCWKLKGGLSIKGEL